MNIDTIDNFLNNDLFLEIKSALTCPYFPWYWNRSTIDLTEKYDTHTLLCEKIEDYQFTHAFFDSGKKVSSLYPIIEPLLENIKYESLLRVKANLVTRTKEIVRFSYHVDYDFECKTSIFYLNTCDGYTEFENGEKVDSIENRFITFDSSFRHTGTSCTNDKSRFVINLNYIT